MEASNLPETILETSDHVENEILQDINELSELQSLNVWGQHQEVLEQQALEELQIFADQNRINKNPNTLEDGEILDDKTTKVANSSLDIDSYIKKQQEFKKRQDYKRALQADIVKSKVDKLSKSHNDHVSKNLVKRKLPSETATTSKIKKTKYNDEAADGGGSSGSEYFPSDQSDYEGEEIIVKKKTVRQNHEHVQRVRDDGCLEFYNARMKEYYKNLENNPEDLLLEDVVLSGGLKVPQKLWDSLYRYQQKGLKWLWKIHQEEVGGLLGDEMGLGKTVQIIAFLVAIEHSKIVSRHGYYTGLGPTLIVAPATVIHQWVQHFQEWAPEMRVAVLHQSGSYIGNKFKLIREINKCKGVLITTYSGILKYAGSLRELQWHFAILDEGHKIRNPTAKVSVEVKKFQTLYRIMLTGSPMQNSLQELWSLFDFVVPGMLGTLQVFTEHFTNPIMQGGFANATAMQETTARSVAKALKDLITPHLLRRSKNEVKHHISLPNKSEQVLFCSLSDEQLNLYKDYLMSENVNSILGRGVKNWFSHNQIRSNVFAAITVLRKICNHPDLYLGDPDNDDDDEHERRVEDKFGYYKRSGKMVVVSALLKIWKKQKHKVLLFTQSRGVLDIFEEFFKQHNYKYLKMNGSTSIASRQPLIDKFNRDPSYDVFLLTTRVGGLGVNLTGANRVIIFDPDWNPATDTQARERAWRIGQEKDVTVYRLISAGTIEEKMYQRQVWKQLLSNKVLLDPKTQRFFKTSDLYDLFSLQEPSKGSNPETANIFRNSRVNLQQKIDKKNDQKESTLPKAQFSIEKIEAMKALAQRLSKNIVGKANGGESNQKSIYQKELEEERAKKLQERESLKTLTPIELRNLNRYKLNTTKVTGNEIDDNKTNLGFSEALEMSENKSKLYHAINNKKANCSKDVEDRPQSSKKSLKKNLKPDSVKIDTSGKVDGEKIEGLIKIEKKKKEKSKRNCKSESSESQDLFILEKLFSKKGVHTALEHEDIVQSGYKNENRIKLDYEAQQQTDAALKALKKSRADKLS